MEALASTVFLGMDDFNGADPSDVMFEIATVMIETFWPTPDVERWLDDNHTIFGDPLTYEFKTIQCIKEVRVHFGIGLKDAKDAVEDWRKGKGYVPRAY